MSIASIGSLAMLLSSNLSQCQIWNLEIVGCVENAVGQYFQLTVGAKNGEPQTRTLSTWKIT